jgi:hypothetical protein
MSTIEKRRLKAKHAKRFAKMRHLIVPRIAAITLFFAIIGGHLGAHYGIEALALGAVAGVAVGLMVAAKWALAE